MALVDEAEQTTFYWEFPYESAKDRAEYARMGYDPSGHYYFACFPNRDRDGNLVYTRVEMRKKGGRTSEIIPISFWDPNHPKVSGWNPAETFGLKTWSEGIKPARFLLQSGLVETVFRGRVPGVDYAYEWCDEVIVRISDNAKQFVRMMSA